MNNFDFQLNLENDFIAWNDFRIIYFHQHEKSFSNTKVDKHHPVSQLQRPDSMNRPDIRRAQFFTVYLIRLQE